MFKILQWGKGGGKNELNENFINAFNGFFE